MFTTPWGTSASSSASFSAVSGVCSEGLRTTVLPAASAGPSFHAAIIKRIIPRRDRGDTPTGSRRIMLV
jgi:hypothetical protein